MRLLNIFSGTESVAIPWRQAGHEVISVDIDGRYNPEVCEDILQVSYCKFPTADVIWASPPCDQFARCRTRARKPRNLELGVHFLFQTYGFHLKGLDPPPPLPLLLLPDQVEFNLAS